MKLLVTGAGRSGTHWLAEALRKAGVPTTHEVAFNPTANGTRINWEAEVSWPAGAYLPVPDAYVVHLVRHPLKVVASLLVRGTFNRRPPRRVERRWGAWASRRCPEVGRARTDVGRAAAYWVGWNRKVQAHARERVRLEDLDPDEVTRLARIVRPGAGLDTLPAPVGATARLDPVEWADVEHVPGLVEMAERYGYR